MIATTYLNGGKSTFMTQYNLVFESKIQELEQPRQWKKEANLLYQQWKERPNDFNRLLCAGTGAWYSILAIDYDKNDPNRSPDIELPSEEEVDQIFTILTEVTRWGFAHFANNAVFNAYFGYMIRVMPYFFYDYQGDYDGWQAKGTAMMRRAYQLEPDNPFAKAISFEPDFYDQNMPYKETPYYKACKELWEVTTPEQWGNSEIQQYFFRILMGNSFYPDAYEHTEDK